MIVSASLHVLVTEKVQQASTITLAPRCSHASDSPRPAMVDFLSDPFIPCNLRPKYLKTGGVYPFFTTCSMRPEGGPLGQAAKPRPKGCGPLPLPREQRNHSPHPQPTQPPNQPAPEAKRHLTKPTLTQARVHQDARAAPLGRDRRHSTDDTRQRTQRYCTAAPAAHACACSVRAPLFFSFLFFLFFPKKKKKKQVKKKKKKKQEKKNEN